MKTPNLDVQIFAYVLAKKDMQKPVNHDINSFLSMRFRFLIDKKLCITLTKENLHSDRLHKPHERIVILIDAGAF